MTRQRVCERTPHKVKFFDRRGAAAHIARTNTAPNLDHQPRRPYYCTTCGWWHVASIRRSKGTAA